VSDVFDLFGEEPGLDPAISEALDKLAEAVRDLPRASQHFTREPDLRDVADAVEALLAAAGHDAASVAAHRWALCEWDGRRTVKVHEAKARAESSYREDLERIGTGWRESVPVSAASQLPWIQPDEDGSGNR